MLTLEDVIDLLIVIMLFVVCWKYFKKENIK